MRKIIYFAMLILILFIAQACATQKAGNEVYNAPRPNFSTPVSIEELRSAFYGYSVVAIVAALRENNEANWNMLLDKARAGEGDWIYALNAYVAPGADAANSTAIIVTLATALSNNPEAVLNLGFSHGPSLYQLCSLPFIEPEDEFLEDYAHKTLHALQNIDKPYLLDLRDYCLRTLRASWNHSEN
jgi:hypothetical protein